MPWTLIFPNNKTISDLYLYQVLDASVRVLSHLPHLVRLNYTRVSFPSLCGSFGKVRMQQSHSGAHQKRTKQAVSVHFQINPGAVCLW